MELDSRVRSTVESRAILVASNLLAGGGRMKSRNLVVSLLVLILVALSVASVRVDARPQAAGNMIYVPVMVTDSKNVPITTLAREHFQVLEDNKEQKIEYFAGASEPMTLGLVMGLSLRGPVKAAGQKDRVTVDITNAASRVREAHTASTTVNVVQLPLDSDALFTSVTKAVDDLSKQPSTKKALVIVGDGLNSSGTSGDIPHPNALVNASKNMPFPIHFLLLVQSLPAPSFTEGTSNATGFYLQQIAEFSGGEMFVGQIENDLTSVSTALRDGLKNQYVLGFNSPNTAKDGKWRKLTVKLT